MYGQIQPTEWDINFTLLGIPVRINPFFWLIAIVFGWGLQEAPLIALWVIAMFFSILVHEMGHALVIKAFGFSPHVVLHHFGGYASYVPGPGITLGKSIVISLAGPMAGFTLFGLCEGIHYLMDTNGIEISRGLFYMYHFLAQINLYWGLINLLPVLPLDGGQVCRDTLLLFRRHDGEIWAIRIGIVVGAGIAIYFLQHGQQYPAILFGILAINNLQAINHRSNRW